MLRPIKETSITKFLDGGKKKEENLTHSIYISQYNSFDEADICDSPTE